MSDEVTFNDESGLNWNDISSEDYRVYEFADTQIKIQSPLKLNVSRSGGHRIFDANGVSHYIPGGWRHLYWEARPGSPNFVK
ncbi:MAG: hypothetical protein M0R77_18495 [Gammaproteobacteria bacterium]|nr:hypothetical protein [Gammaproteobacteria bacterium]